MWLVAFDVVVGWTVSAECLQTLVHKAPTHCKCNRLADERSTTCFQVAVYTVATKLVGQNVLINEIPSVES